jgi:hypothetical protein
MGGASGVEPLTSTASRAVMVLIPNVRKNALSGVAEVCRDLWRTECVTKGARPDAASYLSLTVLKTKEQRGKKVVAAEAVRTCGDNLILF